MSRSKFLILFALVMLMAVPAGVAYAQTPVLINAQTPATGTVMAVVSDGASMGSRLTVTIEGASPAPADSAYEGWLVSDDGSDPLSVGIINVGPGGGATHVYDSPDGENLIAGRNTFVISVEPVPDSDPAPSDDKPYVDSVPLAAMAHVRHLLVSWPDGDPNGILTNLKMQLDTAITHAQLARGSDDIDTLRQHIHHVINIVEGADGDNFDASFGNPGDGVGVLAHAQDRKHAGFAAGQAPGDQAMMDHGDLVNEYGANAEMWAADARDEALDILDEDSLTIAKTLLNTVEGRLSAARNGIAATGDGGAEQAYEQAQLMASYNVPSMRGGGGAVAAASGGFPGLPSVGDTSVPIVAQLALIVSITLLGAGGLLMIRDRRRKRA